MSVFDLDDNHPLRAAHKHSANHREEIINSFICGCFYCLSLYKPTKIQEWVDNGSTAICPKCGIDSVLGDASDFDLDEGFLREMNAAWF